MHDRGPRRRREKGLKKIFEKVVAENFPNMGREIVYQILEMQRVPGRIKPRRNLTKTQSNQIH